VLQRVAVGRTSLAISRSMLWPLIGVTGIGSSSRTCEWLFDPATLAVTSIKVFIVFTLGRSPAARSCCDLYGCCSVVQCVAVWCSVLQCVAVTSIITFIAFTYIMGQPCCSQLLRFDGCCSVAQCVAAWCSMLQCVLQSRPSRCSLRFYTLGCTPAARSCCVLNACCGVLPCVAVWCRVVPCGAVCCNVLQCVAATSMKMLIVFTLGRMCMFACILVFMNKHMCVCIHACMYVCKYACLFACMFVCLYIYSSVCLYIPTYTCMYACVYTCMHARTCIHACIYACMHAYMHLYTRPFTTQRKFRQKNSVLLLKSKDLVV